MDIEAQSCRFSRASTDVANTAFSQSSQLHAPFSQLALAIQSLNGNTILVMVPVQKAANGEQAWTRIRELARQASIAHQLEDWTQGIFAKQAVGTAKIQQVPYLSFAVLSCIYHPRADMATFRPRRAMTEIPSCASESACMNTSMIRYSPKLLNTQAYCPGSATIFLATSASPSRLRRPRILTARTSSSYTECLTESRLLGC